MVSAGKMRGVGLGEIGVEAAGEIQRPTLLSVSSRLPFGMFVVDQLCNLTEMNEAAEALLSGKESPFRLNEGRIEASNALDTERIHVLVSSAFSSEASAMPDVGGSLLILSYGSTVPARLVLSVALVAKPSLLGGETKLFSNHD